MSRGEQLALAARKFLDTPFRLHGREPGVGLDCVGLLIASLDAIGIKAAGPTGYAFRNLSVDRWLGCALEAGLTEVTTFVRSGDVLLIRTGPHQDHIMIAADCVKAIHAHAGLGRVVIEPLPEEMPAIKHWRLLG